jgi:hypothetical protein
MVDLDELARRAVAAPPVQPSALATLEHRARQRRRRRRLAGAAPLLAMVVVVAIGVSRVVGDGNDDAPVVAGEPDQDPVPQGWSEHQAAGVSVAVPAGWVFTEGGLTSERSGPGPRMVWAVGTLPVSRFFGEACAHEPTDALDHFEPDSALVVLYERSTPLPYVPDREHPLWAMRGDPDRSDPQGCSPGDVDSWRFSFNDQGRGFSMLVSVGPEAENRICDVERLVNSVTVADRGGELDERGSATTVAPCTDPRNPLWDLRLGHDHLGPLQVGMTVEQATEALGEAVVPKETGSACALYRPISAPTSIEFRVDDGRIVVIQADRVASQAGVAVGDPEGAIREAYTEETIVDVSHPAGRREVVVRPTPDSAHATVFDIEAGTVARMRSGTHPEVEPYLEGCT